MPKIPIFKTETEEARFWDTHDSTLFLDQMREVRNIKFPKPKHKSLIVDLDSYDVENIKKLAQRKHIPYHTLIQRWLKERVFREIKAALK